MTYAVSTPKSPLADMLALVRPTSYADLVALITIFVASCVYLARGKVWDKPDSLHHLWFEVPQLKDGFKKRASNKETTNIAEKLKQTVC
jgi:NADPH-ferrihemoprotein reductase